MHRPLSRRQAIASIAAAGFASSVAQRALARRAPSEILAEVGITFGADELTLPPLPYSFDALEPSIDAETMQIHHDKHHKAYVDNANKALAGTPLAGLPADQILAKLADAPADKMAAIRNNVGGHVNHSLFWQLMAPAGKGGGGEPTGTLADSINSTFGSFAAFKELFAATATTRFGSGWAWLIAQNGTLVIASTPNQDTPLMGEKLAGVAGVPILGLDVWEHAYYLKYRNVRGDYIKNWWNVANWTKAAELLKASR